jgi:hypothetical protein
MTKLFGGFAPTTPPKIKTFLRRKNRDILRPPVGRARGIPSWGTGETTLLELAKKG